MSSKLYDHLSYSIGETSTFDLLERSSATATEANPKCKSADLPLPNLLFNEACENPSCQTVSAEKNLGGILRTLLLFMAAVSEIINEVPALKNNASIRELLKIGALLASLKRTVLSY